MSDDQASVAEEAIADSEGMDASDSFDEFVDDLAVAPSTNWSSWSNLWQIPAIVFSAVLIVAGVYFASQRAPKNDFDGAMDQIDELISIGEFDDAKTRLQTVIEPNLAEATVPQQARFQAVVADWIAAFQETDGASTPANNRLIVDGYMRAVELGAIMTPVRHERWGNALVELGEIDEARKRLEELDALGVTDSTGKDARARRNRLLRRMVDYTLARESLSPDAMAAILEEYRQDPLLSPADEAWAIARQAELRLEMNEAVQAVERLLVDMRRLEQNKASIEPAVWGELYSLLGRAYYNQGRYDDARYHLKEALNLVGPSDPVRADALLSMGRISVARDDIEAGFAAFDEIVLNYAGSRAYLPALLARAEANSVLGNHEKSLEDFALLTKLMPSAGPRRDLSPRIVAASLADRHDAALTRNDLPLALRYVSQAESLFDATDVPIDVLFRIASTSRQIAQNIITGGLAQLESEGRPARLEDVDPAVRHEAQVKFEKAGDYFIRHARALTAMPEADEDWADSLWLAADSYDLAARRQKAIEYFLEYIAGRAIDDPRRAEVTFRLAQAFEAELDYEKAAEYYSRVAEEHPRSVYGTGSHVPLARCLLALDRRQEAETHLRDVVEDRYGDLTPLTPEAADYRDALIALGKLYYDSGDYKSAIEQLTTAERRYPEDERINEVRFRLADSYRRYAAGLRAHLDGDGKISPDERLATLRTMHESEEKALDLFDQTCAGYAELDERYLDRLQRDYLRYAWLYRGDCAYDMGQYELAAELYDKAARKYSDHYASMHALVQIYNCYYNLADTRRAEVAHHNAMIRLRQLPDDAFNDPQAIMDREAWEQWLRSRPVGSLAQSSGSTVPE